MGKSAYFKLMFSLYCIVLVIGSGCRIILKLFHTDLDTGFYTIQSPLIWVFHGVLLVSTVILFGANRLKTVDNDYPLVREGPTLGVLALLTGVSLALYTLENTGWMEITQHTGTPLKGWHIPLCGTLGILAALSFFTLGLIRISGYRRAPNGLMVLVPAIWQLILLVAKFNNYTTLTTVTDHLLAVLFMVFAAMFMIGHARTITGFARKDGRNYTIPTGLAVSYTGLLLVVPNYVYMFINRSPIPEPYLGDMESLFVLFFSLYALTAVLQLRRSIGVV